MQSKLGDVQSKDRVGILRKRNPTVDSGATSNVRVSSTFQSRTSTNTSKTRDGSLARPKSNSTKAANKPSEDGGSIFSKRTKILRDIKPVSATFNYKTRTPISACISAATIDSRITATSQSSLSHKPSRLPAYLRNKPGTGNKHLSTVQVQYNKKQFNQIKKELADLQKKAIEYYNQYRESLVKQNKLNGKDDTPPEIEKLEIVKFSETSEDVPPPIALPIQKECEKSSLTKLKQITDAEVLNQISQQVQDIQVSSFKLLQEFSNRLSEINNQMKTTSENAESGDTNLFPTQIQNLFEEIEKKILSEQETHSSQVTTFMSNLKEAMANVQCSTVLENGMAEEYENFKKDCALKIAELENKVKELESIKNHEEHRNSELSKSIAKDQAIIKELKCVLAQHENKYDEKVKEIERLNQKLKQFELNNKRYEKLIESKTNEILLKEKSIVELKSNAKSLQDKLSKLNNQTQKFENKLLRTEEEAKAQMDQLKFKYQEELKISDQLRREVTDLMTAAAGDNKPLRDENEKLKTNEKELEKEIYTLKLRLAEMIHRSTLAEKAKTEEQVYRREIDRMENELKRMKTNVNELQSQVNNKETQLTKKTREIADLTILVKQLEQRDKVNQYKIEIVKLQDLISQKTKENEQLQNDLSKAQTDLRLQEESLFMQQRLLKIRSELIQSLQENEQASKSHLAELSAEVDKKSFVTKQLNQEVTSKMAELDNLFSELGAKDLEMKRQDNVIKLLEETHERNQRIRVRQEEKISRLENENAELKQFIKYKE